MSFVATPSEMLPPGPLVANGCYLNPEWGVQWRVL
ncbi:MAG: hypothetical protein QOD34_1592 [Mycobacterium sp.]|jgi:hypothetical protein|nr:hypothetical protein [Mycobacterium sp.]MDT5204956.1 hypothetical protein [Mycobacterium sp.]MDT7734070.1 hypothetical protein [Mycobacterium sp.]